MVKKKCLSSWNWTANSIQNITALKRLITFRFLLVWLNSFDFFYSRHNWKFPCLCLQLAAQHTHFVSKMLYFSDSFSVFHLLHFKFTIHGKWPQQCSLVIFTMKNTFCNQFEMVVFWCLLRFLLFFYK